MGKRQLRRERDARRGAPFGGGAAGPPSAEGRAGAGDGRTLARVRALLAKAESTPYEAEAQALTAKAQELMARYAISAAMVEESGAPGPEGAPERLDIQLEPPYVDAKAFLLGSVARANRCRLVWSSQPPLGAVFGFADDLQAVELLYTSLLIQAARGMAAAGPVRDLGGTSRTRSFRRSFLLGFAGRIGERLRQVEEAAVADVSSETGVALVPLFAARARRVEAAVREPFPHSAPYEYRISNGGGYLAGREAGDRAALGGRPLRGSSPHIGAAAAPVPSLGG